MSSCLPILPPIPTDCSEGSSADNPPWAQTAAARLRLPPVTPPIYSDKKPFPAYLDDEKGILYSTSTRSRTSAKGGKDMFVKTNLQLPREEERTESRVAEVCSSFSVPLCSP